MKDPNLAPTYAAMYAELAAIARSHGYALAIHGSLAVDFDLVCIPWANKVKPETELIEYLFQCYAPELQNSNFVIASKKNHGRTCYSIPLAFGDLFLDISFVNNMKVLDCQENSGDHCENTN